MRHGSGHPSAAGNFGQAVWPAEASGFAQRAHGEAVSVATLHRRFICIADAAPFPDRRTVSCPVFVASDHVVAVHVRSHI